MARMIILDHLTGDVNIIPYDENLYEGAEDAIEAHGWRFQECSWLFSEADTLSVNIFNK